MVDTVLIRQKKMKNAPMVEKVKAEDFEKVYPLLLDFNNPKITKTQWKRLFIDNWGLQKEFLGYKLVVGNKIVGFVAYILSKKLINGKWENFCNLSSWIVKPEFRSSAVDLLYPMLDLKDYTITSFTPGVVGYKVMIKLFKLKILDGYEVIMPALPGFSVLLRKNFKVITRRKNQDERLIQLLSDHEGKIFQDHGKFDCHHVVITMEQGNLYLILKKTYKRHLPFAKVYYINNPELFSHHLEDIRFRVPLALKTVGIVVDSRFLQGKAVPFKKTKKFFMPMVYRSDHLQPHEVDYLYSEFFLLGA
jgi:hypothetical protein